MTNLNPDMATVDMQFWSVSWLATVRGGGGGGGLIVFFFLQKVTLESSNRITDIEGF